MGRQRAVPSTQAPIRTGGFGCAQFVSDRPRRTTRCALMVRTSRLGGDRKLWLIENDAHPNVIDWQTDAAQDLFGARTMAAPSRRAC
jgi:hypothetical protein